MKKGRSVRYIISFAAGFAVIFLICCLKRIFSANKASVIFQILCDAFFVTGIFWSGAGLLLVITDGGFFDVTNYGMYLFFNSFKSNVKDRKYKDYTEYREAKRSVRHGTSYLLITGVFFIAVAVIMLICYHNI